MRNEALESKEKGKDCAKSHHSGAYQSAVSCCRKEGEVMKTLRSDIHIDASAEEVHRFGQNPEYWEQWYTGFKGPRMVSGHGEAGTVVEGKYALMGLRLPIRIEVIESTDSQWRIKIIGPMEGEQIVRFTEEGAGSHLEMITTYGASGKLFSKIANNRLAEKVMLRSMEKTITNWKAMCEMRH